MMATRSQSASASERMWVEKKTVLPSCLSCSIRSRTSRRPSGSSPDIGSSKKTSLGSCRIACAIPARCSMPLENLRNCTPLTSVRPTRCEHFLHPALAVLAGNSRKLPVVVEQFVRGQVIVEVGLFGKKSDLRFDLRIGPIMPQMRALPAVGNTSPISIFSVVVFPAPLGPRKPKISPSSTVRCRGCNARLGRLRQKPTM